jgi:hypothetical protein
LNCESIHAIHGVLLSSGIAYPQLHIPYIPVPFAEAAGPAPQIDFMANSLPRIHTSVNGVIIARIGVYKTRSPEVYIIAANKDESVRVSVSVMFCMEGLL